MRVLSISLVLLTSPGSALAKPLDYNFDVKPILSDRCFLCHGFDEKHRQADLRLDTPEGALTPIKGKAPIVPHKPEESEVWRRIISTDPAEVMPTPESHLTLNAEEKNIIKRWIEEGAKYDKHWAFMIPDRPRVPEASDPGWVKNPIDAFILARLDKEELKPSPPADPITLNRRLSLDLTGLPLANPAQDQNVESQISTLLDSPHFGERWALPWLDAARYADSNGFQGDPNNYNYPWRDYVIRSLNENKPQDQFITELLAGDLLEEPTQDQLVATAFNRMHPISDEGGAIKDELRYNYYVDRVDAVSTTFLGLTFACSQCHDHKYDPLSQKDYYRFMAFFSNIKEEAQPRERIIAPHHHYKVARPTLKLKVPEIEAHLTKRKEAYEAFLEKNKTLSEEYESAFRQWILTTEINEEKKHPKFNNFLEKHILAYRKRDGKINSKQREEITEYFRDHVAQNPDWINFEKTRQAEEAKVQEIDAQIPRVMVMKEEPGPAQHKLHDRGLYDAPVGEPLPAAIPSALGQLPAGAANRLSLAKWLVSRDNPLTARVMVNRIWQEFFGTGIVKTPEDFGFQAALPSHPELLDWLAIEFQESGWDFKKLVSLIVSSNTYQQSSRADSILRQKDPENRLLARGPRFRISSALIRDQALAVSGLLDRSLYGAPVYPEQPDGLWEEVSFGNFTYPKKSEPSQKYRRSLYTFWRRTLGPPNMFDAANRQMCSVKSSRTNTPLHALTLLNDKVYVEAALALAKNASTAAAPIDALFQQVTSRLPSEQERQILQRTLEREQLIFAQKPEEAEKLTSTSDPKLAALTLVAQMILNLDESLTKE